MKKIILIGICLSLCLSLGGCKKQEVAAPQKENSGGSGYGVTQKSSLTLNDLYFFSVNTTKEEVLSALGSPQKYTIAADGAVTYLLDSGASLELTYNNRNVVKTAVYTDESGEKQNLFALLVEEQVLESAGAPSQNQNTGVGNQAAQSEKENGKGQASSENSAGGEQGNQPSSNQMEQEQYFSSERYSLDIASKLLAAGAKRQKILSALGKPNGYSSVSFAKDSYLIDLYYMEDGSIYYLDYGYEREALRAVRAVKGSSVEMLLGSWEQQKRPKDFYYVTRNLTLFTSLKKGAKPADIYRRYGDPDWYEGNASHYKDAYQLMGGAVLYLDFGSGHNMLSGATVRQADGSVVPYNLR